MKQRQPGRTELLDPIERLHLLGVVLDELSMSGLLFAREPQQALAGALGHDDRPDAQALDRALTLLQLGEGPHRPPPNAAFLLLEGQLPAGEGWTRVVPAEVVAALQREVQVQHGRVVLGDAGELELVFELLPADLVGVDRPIVLTGDTHSLDRGSAGVGPANFSRALALHRGLIQVGPQGHPGPVLYWWCASRGRRAGGVRPRRALHCRRRHARDRRQAHGACALAGGRSADRGCGWSVGRLLLSSVCMLLDGTRWRFGHGVGQSKPNAIVDRPVHRPWHARRRRLVERLRAVLGEARTHDVRACTVHRDARTVHVSLRERAASGRDGYRARPGVATPVRSPARARCRRPCRGPRPRPRRDRASGARSGPSASTPPARPPGSGGSRSTGPR